jgi:hypothetical protein
MLTGKTIVGAGIWSGAGARWSNRASRRIDGGREASINVGVPGF